MLGTLFSSGMMEIARSGVFHPEMFTFSNIMMLFLAVMLTDVILLDIFNSLGLPTSTTVSLVFELLGAAVAVALFMIAQSGDGELVEYINTGKALAIISGIFVSVGIAFVVGCVVMYVSRLIFSFNYKKSYRYFGALWCGFALTAITYFIVFKGLKNSPIVADNLMNYLENNTAQALFFVFLGWTTLMAILQFVFRVNVLKIIVLVGTMALALAFASNDLVNFIGVFMAGFESFNIAKEFVASGGSLDTLYMDALNGSVKADVWILLGSGIIMVLALWFSKKSRSVTETEVNLGRQNAGIERFSSTPLSRSLVRAAVNMNKSATKIIPNRWLEKIDKRFQIPEEKVDDGISFDLIRASVNLTLSALLISLGTSLKLPLSTTYVTFMVAMGSSLADRAWGRESAVYRITGVLTVTSGWFITALVAFTIALLVGLFLVWGGTIAIGASLLLVVYILMKSSKFHNKRKKTEAANTQYLEDENSIVKASTLEVKESISKMLTIYQNNINGLAQEDRSLLHQMNNEAEELYRYYKNKRTYEVVPTIQAISQTKFDIEQDYVQIVDYTYEICKALRVITADSSLHIDNNHKGLTEEQEADLYDLSRTVTEMYETFIDMINNRKYDDFENTVPRFRDEILDKCTKYTKRQIKRVKEKLTGTRNSILFLNILNETKNITLQSGRLMRSQKNMIVKANQIVPHDFAKQS